MAESSAPGLALTSTEQLLSAAAPRAARWRYRPWIRRVLAAALGLLLAQFSFGPALPQLTGAALKAAQRRPPSAPLLAPAITPTPTPMNAPIGTPLLMPRVPDLRGACAADMVLVEGAYCTDVLQSCARWLDDEALPFARCSEFRAPSRCIGKRVMLRFCMDRYEYTAPGTELPISHQSFQRSSALCESLGKRLCTESEWTFACEGEEMRPYPYGFAREAKCNQDRSDLYEPNPHRQILADRRERADARPDCVSPFGVYNLAGNMDESVLREGKEHISPFRNALKGGWWMAARNRCRPATTAHDDYYNDLQVGTRCCSSVSN